MICFSNSERGSVIIPTHSPPDVNCIFGQRAEEDATFPTGYSHGTGVHQWLLKKAAVCRKVAWPHHYQPQLWRITGERQTKKGIVSSSCGIQAVHPTNSCVMRFSLSGSPNSPAYISRTFSSFVQVSKPRQCLSRQRTYVSLQWE